MKRNFTVKIKDISGRERAIDVNPEMTIGDAKNSYGYVGGVWIFFGEKLEDDKTFSYYKIKDGRVIGLLQVCDGGGGGFGLSTIDIEKNNIRTIERDDNAPSYRMVEPGLSVQAICENECSLKNKLVYTTLGYITNYNILSHLNDIKCPKCRKTVYPKNFGFLHCNYEIEYDKWENNKKKSGSIEGKSENEFILFSEYSGIATFSKLIFDVTPYRNAKSN